MELSKTKLIYGMLNRSNNLNKINYAGFANQTIMPRWNQNHWN
jgi:hypothetical protein